MKVPDFNGAKKIPISNNIFVSNIELVSKELYHLAAILQHYAGGLIFMK